MMWLELATPWTNGQALQYLKDTTIICDQYGFPGHMRCPSGNTVRCPFLQKKQLVVGLCFDWVSDIAIFLVTWRLMLFLSALCMHLLIIVENWPCIWDQAVYAYEVIAMIFRFIYLPVNSVARDCMAGCEINKTLRLLHLGCLVPT